MEGMTIEQPETTSEARESLSPDASPRRGERRKTPLAPGPSPEFFPNGRGGRGPLRGVESETGGALRRH